MAVLLSYQASSFILKMAIWYKQFDIMVDTSHLGFSGFTTVSSIPENLESAFRGIQSQRNHRNVLTSEQDLKAIQNVKIFSRVSLMIRIEPIKRVATSSSQEPTALTAMTRNSSVKDWFVRVPVVVLGYGRLDYHVMDMEVAAGLTLQPYG